MQPKELRFTGKVKAKLAPWSGRAFRPDLAAVRLHDHTDRQPNPVPLCQSSRLRSFIFLEEVADLQARCRCPCLLPRTVVRVAPIRAQFHRALGRREFFRALLTKLPRIVPGDADRANAVERRADFFAHKISLSLATFIIIKHGSKSSSTSIAPS